jgi:hypothetical protein
MTVAITNIYRAADGAGYSNDVAQAIGERLEQLPVVTPDAVLDDAIDEESPLHPLFQWDDSIAARQFRLATARNIVNHLRVVVHTANGDIETKAFHSVRITTIEQDEAEPFRIYASVAQVQSDEELRDQVLANALAELKRWKARYSEYGDVFKNVFAAIEKAAKKHESI